MKIELYGTYLLTGNDVPVMCIGIEKTTNQAVFAPFYADDEDGEPSLHAKDGVEIWDAAWLEHSPIKMVKAYKLKPKFQLTAELVGFEEESP